MRIERVLVLCKKLKPSPLPRETGPQPAKHHAHLRLILAAQAEHARTIVTIRETLERVALPHCLIELPTPLKEEPNDLVISVGGDGTLLFASHFVESAPILGVNSSPRTSVGVFCGATAKNFAQRLREVLESRIRKVSLGRMSVTLNGQVEPPFVLNDCLIIAENPAETYRYAIEVGGERELQRSSGIWVSTAAGSTGGIRSAGGRVLPLRSRRIQFLVREPYTGNRPPFRLARGTLPRGAEIKIANLMPSACIYTDGPKTPHRLHYEDSLRISADAPSLTLLGVDESLRRRM